MPDRFSEDEARRIFARAAERQHAEQQRPEGLSLAELQEIGRSAGLDPEHVTAAVAEVRAAAPVRPGTTLWGVDVEPRAARVVPGALTDEAWGQMVGRVRPTFKTVGVTNTVGRMREWNGTNSQGGLSNLRMTAEPVEGGTRVVLETSRADEATRWKWIWPAFGALALLLTLLPTVGAAEPGLSVPSVLLVALSVAASLATRAGFRRWSAKRRGQFDDLLDAFERIAREAAPDAAPLAEPAASGAELRPAEAPALGLDALTDDAPEPRPAEVRRRTRS